MSDTRFTASNGLYVENGQTYLPDGTRATADLSSVRAVLLIEYGAHKAQAERDAALGRWRSVEHPDWVVYPLEREDHVDLLNERNLHRLTIPRSAFYHIEEEDEAYAVKAEYWAAHPEPKPWELAQTGEVWVLTVDGDDTRVVTSVGFEFQDFHGDCFRRLSDSITAGRRIWPEVSA